MKNDKKLGTVEPSFDNKVSEESIAFIIGAIEKYGNDSEYHYYLVQYLKERITQY